jgi:hypothetical protein
MAQTLYSGTITANGNYPSEGVAYAAPEIAVAMTGGSFGSGTATIQIKMPNDSNWVAVESGYTSATVKAVTIPEGASVRVNMAGATSPSVPVTMTAINQSFR